MNETLTFENYQPQNIIIDGGGSVIGLTTVLVNGVDVTEGSVAYVVVPTKLSDLVNDTGFINHEVDPTVPYYVKQISLADINKWNNKQDLLVSGTNIKTINNESILGSGNIEIEETPYTAGTGIEIQNHVINNTITSYNDLSDLPIIPTKTSDLDNDSDYVTSSELSDVAFSGSYLDLSNTPANLSEFTNDEGFITDETNTLQNYMLSEYLDSILPKVTGSGTNITLDNTAKAPMQIEVKGNTSQETTSISGGDEYDSPSPDHPQTIHNVTGDNTITECGINIWDEQWESGSLNYSTGVTEPDNTRIRCKNYMPVIPNTIYYLFGGQSAGRECFYDKNKNHISSTSVYNSTFTTPNNAYYMKFTTDSGYGSTYNNDICINVSNSNINGNYYPYDGNTYPLTLGTLEYSKIGNYEDEFIYNTTDTNLELNKWYLKKMVGKVVLDGETTGINKIDNTSYSNDYLRFQKLISDKKPNDGVDTKVDLILSNYFICKILNETATRQSNSIAGAGNNGNINIFIDKTIIGGTETTNLTTWLGTHNIIVNYILATPTYTLIEDTTLIGQLNNLKAALSMNDQTNISQTNQDIGFNITATAFAKIGGLS